MIRSCSFFVLFTSFTLTQALAQEVATYTFEKFIDSTYFPIKRVISKNKGDFKFHVVDYFKENNQINEEFWCNRKPKWNYAMRFGYAKEYGLDGTLRSEGEMSYTKRIGVHKNYNGQGMLVSISNFSKNGDFKSSQNFNKEGILTEHTFYAVREKVDSIVTYYQNGQLMSITLDHHIITENESTTTTEEMVSYWNTDGVKLIENGNGELVIKNKEGRIIERGTYKSGKKNGTWEGDWSHKSKYLEIFNAEGEFVRGELTDSLGKKNEYSSIEIQPGFIGGVAAMYRYIGQNLKYPPAAQSSNTSGRVFIKFVVEKDGKINDVHTVKGVTRELDNEAMKVVATMSGKWYPGFQKGVPVRVYFTMPISFVLE